MMSFIADIKSIKSGEKELRSFGYLFAGIFAVLFGFLWWRHQTRLILLLGIAIVFLLFAVIKPAGLRPVHKAWMTIALAIGWVVTRVLLTILFYLVVTPIGFFAHLTGKKFLDLSFRDPVESYWIARDKTPDDNKKYEIQY